jgi:hypothetical protein
MWRSPTVAVGVEAAWVAGAVQAGASIRGGEVDGGSDGVQWAAEGAIGLN